MDRQTIKSTEHYAYPIPFNIDLKDLDLIPYRTNTQLEQSVYRIFSHPHFDHRETFLDVANSGSKGLVNDMCVRAVAVMRHYLDNPQQYGHTTENIHMQILVRMWRQVYRHKKFQRRPTIEYQRTKMKLLEVSDGFIDLLITTCMSKNYIQHSNDMRKQPKPKRKKRKKTGKSYIDYLCSLE